MSLSINNNLTKIGDSCFMSKYGTSDGGAHILDRLRGLDYNKFKINESSRNYLMGVIDRKVSNESKNKIIDLIEKDEMELIVCSKEDGIPNYLIAFPMAVQDPDTKQFKLKFFINIGYYAKYKKETGEVLDIDPRILFAILTYGYTQFKIYTNSVRIDESKTEDIVATSYKKIFNRIMGKIVNLNVLTSSEKLSYDILLLAYITKVILRKDTSSSLSYIKTAFSKLSIDKDKLTNTINSLNIEQIDSLDSFIKILVDVCPSFKKVSTALVLREYTISMKSAAVLSIDLVQFFIATLLAVNVGSSGIFNDKFVENALDSNELSHLKVLMARGIK